jgi:N-acetylglutamate synthase-like GNAT family acetyltransferase
VSAGRRFQDPLIVRPARASEARDLTALAVRSKAHWGYPETLLALWHSDLALTAELITEESVHVAERAGETVGVVAVSVDGGIAEIEGLWVEPSAMGDGVGRVLFTKAVETARGLGARTLVIVADPNAEKFYLRMGARRTGTVSSRPAGRVLPRLELSL